MIRSIPAGYRRAALAALALVAVASVLVVRNAGRADAAPAPPPGTLSRYMQNVDPARHYDLGCGLGTQRQSMPGTQYDVANLHYFRPVKFSDGTYGASLLAGADARTTAIAAAASEFAHGYYVCTGSDTTSQLTLAIGTSNDGSEVTTAHGKAWSQMVQSVNDVISSNGWSSQTYAVGASDLELGFNAPVATRSWVGGFDSACCPALYDYGDAAGCRSDGAAAGAECGTGSYPSWTAEDVWFIAWGSPSSWPLPQIYRNDAVMAKQWYGLSLYAKKAHGSPMAAMGALVQYHACLETGCNSTLDNPAAEGWTQLWNALNCKYVTVVTCVTAQSVKYSTDISWVD